MIKMYVRGNFNFRNNVIFQIEENGHTKRLIASYVCVLLQSI